MAELSGNLGNTKASLIRAMNVVEPLLGATEDGLVDLTRCNFLGPLAAVYLASAWLVARNLGRPLTMRFPTEPPSLAALFHFSGLTRCVGDGPVGETGLSGEETHPWVSLRPTHSNWLAAQPMIDLLQPNQVEVNDEFASSLSVCAREIFQNIEDHSQSPIGGLYSACHLTRGNNEPEVISVAIIDRGMGIRATLARRYPQIADTREALRRVIAGEYSAQTTPRNLGLGISNVARQVERMGGCAILATQDACAEYHETGEWRYDRLGVDFHGTLCYFSLPVPASGDGGEPWPISR